MKYFVLALFVSTYILIIAFPRKKTLITGIVAGVVTIATLATGNLSFGFLFGSIKYDVILMLLGIMITVGIFTESGMPNMLAEKMISKVPNSLVALTLLVIASGLISAFVDNVATVLMLAPIGLAVAKKIGVSPVPVMITIAVSSNLQGAATLVGDTTSIMLSEAAGMSFFDFFFFNGRFSIFWAVEIGMVLTIPIILLIFRKYDKKLAYVADNVKVTSKVPTVLLLLNMACLVASSFLPFRLEIASIDITNGAICMLFGIISLIHYLVKTKDKFTNLAKKVIDYETILFLLFLFIIIASVTSVGIIDDIGNLFLSVGGENILLLYVLIVGISVVLSAFIDNIPYVATMLPVIIKITESLPDNVRILLFFGLLIGATLGGNLTPFGASANVVGIGILRKEGYEVKIKDFLKIGIPFTMIAVVGGAVFCWLIWV